MRNETRNLVAKFAVAIVFSVGFGSVGCGGGGGGATGGSVEEEIVNPDNPTQPGGGSTHPVNLSGKLALFYYATSERTDVKLSADDWGTQYHQYIYGHVPGASPAFTSLLKQGKETDSDSWASFFNNDLDGSVMYPLTIGNAVYVVRRVDNSVTNGQGTVLTANSYSITKYEYSAPLARWIERQNIQMTSSTTDSSIPTSIGPATTGPEVHEVLACTVVNGKAVWIEWTGRYVNQGGLARNVVFTATKKELVTQLFGSTVVNRNPLRSESDSSKTWQFGTLLPVGNTLVDYVASGSDRGFYTIDHDTGMQADAPWDSSHFPPGGSRVFAGEDALYWSDFTARASYSFLTIHRLQVKGTYNTRMIQFQNTNGENATIQVTAASIDQHGGKIYLALWNGSQVSKIYEVSSSEINSKPSSHSVSPMSIAPFVADASTAVQFMILP